MRAVFTTRPPPSAAVAALGAFFFVGLMYDLRSLADEFDYQHRLMACMGMYELKTNISDEDSRTICDRAVIRPAAADFE